MHVIVLNSLKTLLQVFQVILDCGAFYDHIIYVHLNIPPDLSLEDRIHYVLVCDIYIDQPK